MLFFIIVPGFAAAAAVAGLAGLLLGRATQKLFAHFGADVTSRSVQRRQRRVIALSVGALAWPAFGW